MKTPAIWRTAAITAMAVAAAITFSIAGVGDHRGVQPANAASDPKVIEIKAKQFEFTPSEVTLKIGQPVILRLTTEDRTHGFLSKPLNIDTDIPPGKATDIAVTPYATGEYVIICDHYCGSGHGNMKMKLTVVE